MTLGKTYFGYIGVRKNKEGVVTGFALNRDLTQVKSSMAPSSTSKAADPDETKGGRGEVREFTFGKTMDRIIESSQSQSEILSIVSAFGSMYVRILVDQEISPLIDKLDNTVEVVDNVTIHGLSEEVFRSMPMKRERIGRAERGVAALPAALLMSIVATFDSSIADVVRDMLTLKPQMFKAGIRTVLLSDVLQADSILEIRERSISDELYLFSRGSHEEQVSYVETNFHIAIKDHWKRWPDFIEVFERRNLVAHGEKTFTKRYVSICQNMGIKDRRRRLTRKLS